MIKSVHDYQIDDVFKKDAGFCYMIPKYQREYTWGQYQWKDLYDDICENDNGYFIGSIICIDNSSDAFQTKELEVVDGQQLGRRANSHGGGFLRVRKNNDRALGFRRYRKEVYASGSK